jgi:hypothetical protein
MPASSLLFLLYETLEVGEARDGVPDLLSMVLVRWLDIACLHGLSLTTVSTQYASTISMYLTTCHPSFYHCKNYVLFLCCFGC